MTVGLEPTRALHNALAGHPLKTTRASHQKLTTGIEPVTNRTAICRSTSELCKQYNISIIRSLDPIVSPKYNKYIMHMLGIEPSCPVNTQTVNLTNRPHMRYLLLSIIADLY